MLSIIFDSSGSSETRPSISWRKFVAFHLILFIPLCASSMPAFAGDAINGKTQFLSNYVGRGLSQSVGQPSIETEVNYDPGEGFYVGLSGYSINILDELYPGDSASLLIEGTLGYSKSLDQESQVKFGVQRVQFPGHYVKQPIPMEEPNTTEAFCYFRWSRLSLKLNYSVTDYYGTFDSRGSWYLDGAVWQPISDNWNLGAHVGRKILAGNDPNSGLINGRKNYTDYKLSASYSLTSRLSFSVATTWSNATPTFYTVNGYNVSGHQTWFLVESDW